MKILAIDDKRDNLTSLKAVVRDALPEYTVLTALNGPDGIELARAEDPDVILLDIVMPDMDGFEVCRRLKADELVQTIPVVFLTALRTDRESRAKALDVGAEGFLAKPLDELELVAQVRAMTKLKAANRLQRMEKEELAALVAERTQELEHELAERKQAEKALRKSEERHRSILKTAMDGIWRVDMEGRLLEANDSYCRMSGYSMQELLALCVSDLEAVETAADTAAHMQKVMLHGEDRFESRHRRKDGSIFAVEVSVQYRPDEGGQLVVFLHDITERKRAQERFEKEQSLQIELLDKIPNCVAMILKKDTREIIASNAAAREMGAVPGKTCFQTCAGRDDDCPFCLAPRLWETDQPQRMEAEYRGEWYEGIWEPLSEDSYVHYIYNITARKQAEERDVLAHDVLVRLNQPGSMPDMLRDVIQIVRKSTGFEAVGIRLREGDDFPYYAEIGFAEDFLSTENTLVVRTADGGVCRNKDGGICLACTCGLVLSGKADPSNPLFTEGGSCWTNNSLPLLEIPAHEDPRLHPRNRCIHDGFLSVALIPLRTGDDIVGLLQLNDRRPDRFTLEMVRFLEDLATSIAIAVKREQSEEEQGKLQQQLTQAQKMESVGRLAGGVAHDFNNLIMGVMGYAELCRDGIAADHPIRKWLDEITDASQRTADLTRQLLAFARKQTIAPKVLDLNDVISSMLKLLQKLIGEDINLVWLPGPGLAKVKMDPSQIDQILANLTVNARDAISGVGKVTIETENVSIDADYCAGHAEASPGDYMLLAVSDDGCGMDRETLGHIFEPFFTTKSVDKGTGLGLATVYGIVKQNNGFINVDSEPGKGTTFKIYLSRHGGKTTGEADAATPAALPGGNETILLVEDEKSIRITAALFLKAFGYTVLAADGPKQALQLAAEHSGEIHLLLTDVIMPGQSGRDLAAQLATDRPEMKCLFMSGYTADIIAQRGVLDGGVEFLGKPFTRDALARKVREVLD